MMRPWVIPVTSLVGAVIIAVPAFRVVGIMEAQERARTDYYLSIRVEDVPISQVSEHVRNVGADFGYSCEWIESQIEKAQAEFPQGSLFFFNTSKEQWRALGGEMGYAIVLDGRIVWKKRIAIS
jgi:hypothetical protein